MSAQSTTAHPKSLSEIPQAFQDWWAKYHRRAQSKIRFSRPSGSPNLLVMRSHFVHYLRLQFHKDALSCERSGRRLHLVLDDFDVRTIVDDGFVLCEFKLRQGSLKPLKESLAAVQNTKNPVFFARAINALTGLEHELSKQRIEEACAASTDYLVLLDVLTAPSVTTQLAAKDPLAAARLRGVSRQQSLINESGGVLGGAEVAEVLGISRQAVDKRRRQGQLVGLTQGKRGYAYPAWQFKNGKTLPNLETALGALQAHDPWMQLTFFVSANDRLNGRSPLATLRSGELEPVLQAARSYGEQGAA
jgi:biotin operon repressor